MNLIAYGESGRKYILELYPIGTMFRPIPGIYEFVKQSLDNQWEVLYIGQTENLRSRLVDQLNQHHQLNCIRRNRATHLAIMATNVSNKERFNIETDLRRRYFSTPCNDQ